MKKRHGWAVVTAEQIARVLGLDSRHKVIGIEVNTTERITAVVTIEGPGMPGPGEDGKMQRVFL